MAKTKFVIVGGVAGGATAAARMRRLSEEAEIVLFEKGEYISYANCGLPYYIGGVIEERDKLFVQTPEAFGKRFNIDVRTNSEVTAIDTEQRQVTVKTIDGKTYTERYDKLLLSPGASRAPTPWHTERRHLYAEKRERHRPYQVIPELPQSTPRSHRGWRLHRS